MISRRFSLFRLLTLGLSIAASSSVVAFEPDLSPQPATHPSLAPRDGEHVALNPPSMIWRVDERAGTYRLELSKDRRFNGEVIQVEGIDLPFYNHSSTLTEGEWFWRYRVVTDDGSVSQYSPVKSFFVSSTAIPLPVPPTKTLLVEMPGHPRIFTTPADLESFRSRREDWAGEAWEEVRWQADRHLRSVPPEPDLVSMTVQQPEGPTPGNARWRKGMDVRRQVFFLREGEAMFAPSYTYRSLTSDARKAEVLAYAYLISGDKVYAEAARRWMLFVADARLDFHLSDRAQHDTVVYSYEQGLKAMAVAFDHIFDHLNAADRRGIIEHIEFHGAAAYEYLRDRVDIHLAYQQSHPQQAMHQLLITALATATDSESAAEWTDFLVRQYVNRIAWTSPDGGYFEGQTYGHKFRWILEGLLAMGTATGIDLFQNPSISNSGQFWLYCMALNYWFHHGGDVYSLIWTGGNPADAYISGLMAAMTDDPYVRWWSETVFTDPVHLPLQYASATDLKARPPIDISQAKLFPETGQLSAFDRFYDHGSNRLFFRSSQWGGHSHSHADQNNFVIHAGGEILAADVGYYTYYGDEYHRGWSVTSQAHNTILVNGKDQGKSIESKGRIRDFFHSPDYTFFIGDASEAYEAPLKRFNRAMLFLRPDVYVVYDELEADEPSRFDWLLNTFGPAEIDEDARSMVVAQQAMRLRVDHLLPGDVRYHQSNERRFPIQTRPWSRFTEAFPEPWHIQVTPATKRRGERILALMQTYAEEEGPPVENAASIENATTVGLTFSARERREIVLFRREFGREERIEGDQLAADGLAAGVSLAADDRPVRWFAHGATFLEVRGRRVFSLDRPGNVYGNTGGAGGAAQVTVETDAGAVLETYAPVEPRSVYFAPEGQSSDATPASHTWQGGMLTVTVPSPGNGVFWIDPATDPRRAPPSLSLAVEDASGEYNVELSTAVAEDGDWVAFGQIDPRETGQYRFSGSESGEWLVQDRWDPVETSRGGGSVNGRWVEGTELFFRFAPGREPELRATLEKSDAREPVNVLRNGGFEEGIPGYPPRGWTLVRADRTEDTGWGHWTQEEAFTGKSALKFVRPKDGYSLRSQPMRLLSGGEYVLEFAARGDATNARVEVRGNRAQSGRVRLEPSDEWRTYRHSIDLLPGYTEVWIVFEPGDADPETIWVDAMTLGLAPSR